MLRCKQVTTMLASDELADAGPWLRLKIRLHVMMCRHCARYAVQMRAIGARVRERFHSPQEPAGVDELEQRILELARKSRNERDSAR